MNPFEVPRADLVASLAARTGGPAFLLTGPPGSGKSWLLRAVADRIRGQGDLPIGLDLFAAASSPDRFVAATLAALPAGPLAESLAAATRLRGLAESGRQHGAAAVRALFDLLTSLRDAGGRRVVLLLDDATEIRSLAYFQGLREVHEPFLAALRARGDGVVLATAFPSLAGRLWPGLPAVALPPLDPSDLAAAAPDLPSSALESLRALTAGWPRYLRLLWPRLESGEPPLTAWLHEMAPGGLLDQTGRATFEILLLRSRGYGMSKAVLFAVAREEGLNLTALVPRIGRTPGATRDYLQWLVDVDALRREGKRYFFVDPVVRAWVRIHAQGVPQGPALLQQVANELLARLPPAVPAAVPMERPDLPAEAAPAAPSPAPPPAFRRDPLMEID
jgi:hypothetical protein